jgi:hypothetical protein
MSFQLLQSFQTLVRAAVNGHASASSSTGISLRPPWVLRDHGPGSQDHAVAHVEEVAEKQLCIILCNRLHRHLACCWSIVKRWLQISQGRETRDRCLKRCKVGTSKSLMV